MTKGLFTVRDSQEKYDFRVDFWSQMELGRYWVTNVIMTTRVNADKRADHLMDKAHNCIPPDINIYFRHSFSYLATKTYVVGA